MKKICALFFILVLLVAPAVAADKIYPLEEGIATVAKNLSDKLPLKSKIVIFDIRSENKAASEYIIEELTYELLELGRLIIVDRQSLEAIRSELTFQTSGDVSDESAQKLGAMLGAQTLVSGSFEMLSDNYRFSIKAVKVQTSEIQYLSAVSVASNDDTKSLFNRKQGSTGTAAASTTTTSTSAAASAIVPGSYAEGLASGTLVATGNGWYVMSGCCLGAIGILIPALVTPSVPSQFLLGRSLEYSQGFTEGYQKAAKGKNIRNAVIGCTTSSLLSLLYYTAALSAL